MSDTISMDNSKAEILAHLASLEIEADEKLNKTQLLALLVPVDDDVDDEASGDSEPTPPPAIPGDDIVTRRGTSVGGATKMPRSEYERQIAEERDETTDDESDSEE